MKNDNVNMSFDSNANDNDGIPTVTAAVIVERWAIVVGLIAFWAVTAKLVGLV